MMKNSVSVGLLAGAVLCALLGCCRGKVAGTSKEENAAITNRIYAKSRLPGEFKRVYAKEKEEKQVTNLATNVNTATATNVNNNLALAALLGLTNVGVFNAVGVGVGVLQALAAKILPAGFVGRCFGVARKLKFVIPLIIFKLGVIVTILVFLTMFSVKTLGIGIALLVLNVSKFLAKLIAAKDHGSQHSVDSGIHYHIHGKGGYHTYPRIEEIYPDDHGWHDRFSSRLEGIHTDAEKEELLNLYKRIGLIRRRGVRSFTRS